ncbi:MAG TPA: GspJ family type II secretion system protein [Geopsychrobacteraceae bacterium]|jgi:general secretion pathway protein J
MVRQEHGFTLIEILVAISIGAVLLTTIFGVFGSVSGARDRLEALGEEYHQARVLYDRLAGEVRSVYFNSASDQTRLLAGSNTQGHPFLEFSTTLATPLFGGRTGGVSLVRYEQLEMEREIRLYRSEWPLLNTQPEQQPQLLISGLKTFALRYYDGSDWQDEWDSRLAGKLPRMIELTVEVEVDRQLHSFLSTIVLAGS